MYSRTFHQHRVTIIVCITTYFSTTPVSFITHERSPFEIMRANHLYVVALDFFWATRMSTSGIKEKSPAIKGTGQDG